MSKIGQVPRKQTQMCMPEVSWVELSRRKGRGWAEGGAELWCSLGLEAGYPSGLSDVPDYSRGTGPVPPLQPAGHWMWAVPGVG